MIRLRLFLFLFLMLTACTREVTVKPTLTITVIQDNILQPSPTIVSLDTPTPPAPNQSAPTAIFLDLPSATPSQPTATSPAIQHYPPGSPINITNINMIDSSSGWAVAGAPNSDDHVLYTSDGGNLWQDVTPPMPISSSSQRFLGFFLDASNAWVTYYPTDQPAYTPLPVWVTNDGGKTWQQSQPLDSSELGDTYFSPAYLYFIDNLYGWLALANDPGAGHAPLTIFRTVDGGITWQLVHNPFNDSASNLDICCQSGMVFLDEQNGLVTAESGPITAPYVTWTRDGGRSWQSQELPIPEQRFQEGMCGTRSPVAQPPSTVYVVMQCSDPQDTTGKTIPYLYTTTDLGENWSFYTLPVPPIDTTGLWHYNRRDYSTQFLPDGSGRLFVLDFYESGDGSQTQTLSHIYRTVNYGQKWDKVATVFWGGQFNLVNDQELWAVARNNQEMALVMSLDGGKSWVILKPSS